MSTLKHYLPLFLFATLLASCSPDGLFSTESPSVKTAFAGRVLDQMSQPIAGAQVRIGGELATTDANGVFRLPALRVPSDNAKVMVTKMGYYEFSRAYYVADGDLQTITVQLIEKTQTGTLSASSGGTLTLPGGARLVFPAGAFEDERGQVYTGTVRVFAREMPESDPHFAQSMPGDLRALRAGGEEQILGNYGMMGVELQGQSGQALRIRAGSEVTLRWPIASRQINTAPNNITLWYYDIQQTRWIEDGTAQRIGNEYVGTVKHFTFWSFSTAFNVVELKGKVFLVDDQHPLSSAVVRLTMMSDSTKAYAAVNANGVYRGGVPLAETFVMDILNECGEVIFSQNVGPFNEPTLAPDIFVPNNGTHTVSVSGRLLDCAGAPIKNGYAQVLMGNAKWVAFSGVDGSFSLNKTRCDTSATTTTVVGYDLQNLLESMPDTISVPPNTVDVGDLAVCDDLTEYILFTLDNNDFVIAAPTGGLKDSLGMRGFLNGYSGAQQQVGISMEFPSDGSSGIFQLNNLYVNSVIVTTGPLDVMLEMVDAANSVGEYMSGTFDGTFVDHLGLAHTLSGSYRVRRDY